MMRDMVPVFLLLLRAEEERLEMLLCQSHFSALDRVRMHAQLYKIHSAAIALEKNEVACG